MHYIGKIESFDEDFDRLQKAMESKVVNYSPAQRASLIPPRDDSKISRNIPEGESILHKLYFHDVTPNNHTTRKQAPHIEALRKSRQEHSIFQPTIGKGNEEKNPFTVEQVLEVCRRYLQDLICFEYGIPRICIQYADAVF